MEQLKVLITLQVKIASMKLQLVNLYYHMGVVMLEHT